MVSRRKSQATAGPVPAPPLRRHLALILTCAHGRAGTRATLLYDRYVAATGVEAAIDPSLVSSMFPRQLLREPEDAEQ
jgi:hypothetical protein